MVLDPYSEERNQFEIHRSPLGKHLFTFAIVADGHVNPQEDTSSSPWESNRLANARNRFVVSELNRIAPAFVIHLGDMIHPLPSSPAYQTAIEKFNAIYSQLACPLHLIPGNHDVGDKPSTWVPAGSVNDDYLASYRRQFDKDYFSFRHTECEFFLLNCQLLGSNMTDENEQLNWFKKNLDTRNKARKFVFIHYPPFICDPTEDEHYDNLKDPGRTQFLEIVSSSGVEALFSGHVHNFFYNRLNETDCYVLPSITFVRQDYSELSRIGTEDEFGRNDRGKLGFFKVNVYEKGHAITFIRTWGQTLAPSVNTVNEEKHINPLSTSETWWPGLGMDMRHPWAEIVELPYSGVVDEFIRKKVRNDYPLLALWEMGAKRLRLPIHDLVDGRIRKRMAALKQLGHAFTVFLYDTPSQAHKETLNENRKLIDALEIILPWSEISSKTAVLSQLKANLKLPLFLSKLRSSADSEKGSSKFQHFIKHGFTIDEQGWIKSFLGHSDILKVVDGFVFRIGRTEELWESVLELDRFARALDVAAQFQIILANENPALMEKDDLANANRVAEALVLALSLEDMTLILDTFVDMDRGYFPRNGLVDRRFNPRLAAHVYRNLNSTLGPYRHIIPERAGIMNGARTLWLSTKGCRWALVLPDDQFVLREMDIGDDTFAPEGRASMIHLASGQYYGLDWERQKNRIHFNSRKRESKIEGPCLICFKQRRR